jgi:hypothetical protein
MKRILGAALVMMFGTAAHAQGYGNGSQGGKQHIEDTFKSSSVYLHTDNELKPLLENRCYLSKSVSERAEVVHRMNQMPDADFTKTMRDLDAVNATDRLLGTKGCDVAGKPTGTK